MSNERQQELWAPAPRDGAPPRAVGPAAQHPRPISRSRDPGGAEEAGSGAHGPLGKRRSPGRRALGPEVESPRSSAPRPSGRLRGRRASRSAPAAPPPAGPECCCLGGRRPGGLALRLLPRPGASRRTDGPATLAPAARGSPRCGPAGTLTVAAGGGLRAERAVAGHAGPQVVLSHDPQRPALEGPQEQHLLPLLQHAGGARRGHGSGPCEAAPSERPGGGGRGAARAEARPRLGARPLGRAAWSTRAPGHPLVAAGAPRGAQEPP